MTMYTHTCIIKPSFVFSFYLTILDFYRNKRTYNMCYNFRSVERTVR